MTTRITCIYCHNTGSTNNPPVFYSEGETPEVSEDCKVCRGKGFIEVDNPEGIRIAVLVAKKICINYPQLRSWEEVYPLIVVNISNGVNSAISSMYKIPPDFSFEDDTVFLEEALPIDSILEKWIEKGNYLEEAKIILGIKE